MLHHSTLARARSLLFIQKNTKPKISKRKLQMISIFTTAWDRPEFAPKYNKLYIFWQRSYLLCFSFVLKLLIFKQSRWPLKRRTHFPSDSYSAGEVSRIRQLSLFQESENWIWVCEGNINIWPVQNGRLAWQKESSFFPSKYSFRICL